MIDSIMPMWDGNETWLVMTGVTLLAAFPVAYGILMPAFYLPLIVMLLVARAAGCLLRFSLSSSRRESPLLGCRLQPRVDSGRIDAGTDSRWSPSRSNH